MGRILGTEVAPLFPAEGPIRIFLMGEAPGPRGADQSGLPFWGDKAGWIVYRALEAAGMAEVPPEAWEHWDGIRFRELGLRPRLRGAVLGNAFPRCPTADGHSFRAPSDRELREPGNLARIGAELRAAAARCPGRLRFIGLGRRAAWVLEQLPDRPPLEVEILPHPSAQGLLQAAPGKGKGLKLADLEAAWEARLGSLLAFS